MTRRSRRSRRRRRFLGLALVAGLLLAACSSSDDSAPKAGSSTSTVPNGSSTSTTGGGPDADFPYQPLFPFASRAEAAAWQRTHAGDADEAWHLDAAATSKAFATFLGYTGLDRTGTTTGDERDAHVAVGAENSDGRFSTAAIVHLVRIGSGDRAPWEVVGTDDTDFSLTTPGYGAGVTSPAPVGGTITGVDESISVTVRAVHATEALGAACCVPAGGEGSPWSTTVSFLPPPGGVIVIAAATGGHSATVERFTATAATAPRRSA